MFAFGPWDIDLDRRELRALGAAVPLGGRAFAILEVLVGSAGDLVTKDELLQRVWPGAEADENTLQVHIAALRKALTSDRQLVKTEHGRGYRLLGTWRRRLDGAVLPPTRRPPASAWPPTNLPWPESPLIGRAAALHLACDLVSSHRLVTLTGIGGIGKTRLAIEVARAAAPAFAGGAWLVELAPLADARLVPSAVSATLGLGLGGAEITAAAVAQAIGDREILLLLDGCEPVVAAVAALADAVMSVCSRVTLLVASRELLRRKGERGYQVPPLEVPPIGVGAPDDLLRHSAVQLFVARARALRSHFHPNDGQLGAVATICRRLDGIPLALELAAARAAALGVETVHARLDERFALLTGGHRTALPRHRTLRAVLDSSYDLLPEAERRLLRMLAVLTGSFTLEAAAAVGRVGDAPSSDIAEGLANLVAKSLVVREEAGPGGRWRLLESVRAYGLERLAEAGEAPGAARRHARYCRSLVAATPR